MTYEFARDVKADLSNYDPDGQTLSLSFPPLAPLAVVLFFVFSVVFCFLSSPSCSSFGRVERAFLSCVAHSFPACPSLLLGVSAGAWPGKPILLLPRTVTVCVVQWFAGCLSLFLVPLSLSAAIIDDFVAYVKEESKPKDD